MSPRLIERWANPGTSPSCFSHTHSLAFFCAIPIVVAVIQAVNIPWGVVGALVLIGIGVITLVQAFYLREE